MEYKLIVAVSSFPSLYDPSCPTYRDLNTRSDSWRQVSQLVGVPEPECRRKWKMLRDQHRRERLREKDRRESGIGLLNYRPWRYSAILSFLNPFIDARAAGTNGWALDPQPYFQASEVVGCSTTSEARSDDDDNYGFAVAYATTTTTSSSSSSEFVQRKRPSSANRDTARLKEAKVEVTSDPAATDDGVQTQQAQQANMRELFETIMHSVTSLATSLASSQSSSQLSDQLTPPSPSAVQPDLQTSRNPPPQPPSRLHQLKTEEQQEVMEAELLDQTDGEEEEFHTAASPRPTRVWRRRRSTEESLLEEHLRRTEAREAQRERDAEKRDDVTLFLLSLAPAMRRLTAEKQSWLRTKIQQFVHEAEFGAADFQ
ncbi:transcription factor Adf-1-like [Labrus bergylta]|uniref:transcription factor Adf-1-like n=1 Tax=Labrus bergylta TaxID=56723 RepID=UPI003313CD5F